MIFVSVLLMCFVIFFFFDQCYMLNLMAKCFIPYYMHFLMKNTINHIIISYYFVEKEMGKSYSYGVFLMDNVGGQGRERG